MNQGLWLYPLVYADHDVNVYWYVLGALTHTARECPFQRLKNDESVGVPCLVMRPQGSHEFFMVFSLNYQFETVWNHVGGHLNKKLLRLGIPLDM